MCLEKWSKAKVKMATRYYFNLNTKDINDAIKMLELFQEDLVRKCQQFVDALADIGIETARFNMFNLIDGTAEDEMGGGYGEMISVADKVSFSKTVQIDPDGVVAIIIPASRPFQVVWDSGSAVVDPLLMAEFGSGLFAVDGHKGTFPSPTAQHNAENPPWFWSKGGVTYRSYGIEPSKPLFKAYEEMKLQMQTVASQVFT